MQHNEPEALTERDLSVLANIVRSMEALRVGVTAESCDLFKKLQARYLYLEQREQDKGTGAS